MRSVVILLVFILTMTLLSLQKAEAVQSHTPQLLYPSTQRIVVFVADG